ncbi:site-specific integrase [uncultured Parabacteroides sp.]|uniref:site-specific integrase n=1 Tax=uncultured Parabacteroides sp. TaxID=512312 RepID=UPI002587B6AD|nr:site-specific integrase [uncultured Parabacteroides sp.]
MEPDVCDYMLEQELRLRAGGKFSTAGLCRAVQRQLRRFMGNRGLAFGEVTKSLVDEFTLYLHNEKLATNTVNSYLSNFRAIYNAAREAGLLEEGGKSPFAHLRLRREISVKRALSSQTISELARMQPSAGTETRRALDLFLFCFMACGMPFVDLAHLKWDNIVGKEIVYHRRKTGTRVQVTITPAMRLIIRRYARAGSRYLFPILPEEGCSYERYKAILARYNATLREIGSHLSHPVKLTSYVARHSWATEALRQNTPIAVISQSLGHTSEKTTRIYLDSLDQSVLQKANRKITRIVNDLIMGRA